MEAEAAAELTPRHVALHQLNASEHRRSARRHRAGDVVVDLSMRDSTVGSAQGADREGACDREEIDRLKERRVVPREQRRKEQERDRHDSAPLVERNVPGSDQRRKGCDERNGPNPCIDAEPMPDKEHVGEDPQCQAPGAERESNPIAAAHRRLF